MSTTLTEADKLYYGSSVVDKMYVGTQRVWPRSYAEEVLRDNPLAYYRLAETSGTVAVATVGPNATYVGGPTLNNGPSSTPSGKCVTLDGVDDQIILPASLVFPAGGSITIEWWQYIATAWVKATRLFNLSTDTTTQIPCCWIHSPFSDQTFYWDYGQYPTGRMTTSYTPYLNAWILCHCTYDVATTKHAISVNGVEIATLTASAPLTASLAGGIIGGYGAGNLQVVNLSEIAFYTTALPVDRRLAHYNARAVV